MTDSHVHRDVLDRLDALEAEVFGSEPPPGEWDSVIFGDFAGTVPSGESWLLDGDLNLTGDVVVEGTLTAQGDWSVVGNGHELVAQGGGQLNLAGVEKSGWVRWGDPVVGWEVGDRIAVAPTAWREFEPVEVTWPGSWDDLARPVVSPDVTLPDGRVMRPEVANLSQTAVISNVARVMMHLGAGVQTLKWLRVVDSGVSGELGFYPVHFHLNGDTTRGSLVEGVVVEGGKFRGFVPHGSHGITLRDTVVYRGSFEGYWWDLPEGRDHTLNNTHDSLWEHCLTLRGGRFVHGAGVGNQAIDCVAAASAIGFYWPVGLNPDGSDWVHRDCVSHNDWSDWPGNREGVRFWNNDVHGNHLVENLVVYHPLNDGLGHGAYNNQFHVDGLVVKGAKKAIRLHALGDVRYANVVADSPLVIGEHKGGAGAARFVNCSFPSVVYANDRADVESFITFEGCGLTPADFDLSGINPDSTITIVEGGQVVHEWAGSW